MTIRLFFKGWNIHKGHFEIFLWMKVNPNQYIITVFNFFLIVQYLNIKCDGKFLRKEKIRGKNYIVRLVDRLLMVTL